MNFWRGTAVGAICVAATVSACSRTTEGVPLATSSAPSAASAKPIPTASPTNQAPPFGVVPTNRAPVPANSVTCSPPVRPGILIVAKVPDPRAPHVTVPVPGGWTLSRGSGDVATQMIGPGGATATVTIAATKLDAAQAFRDYADRVTAKYSVSAVSILPAELCDYSGQKLTGTLSNTSGDAVQFNDRVVHVWTNTGDYLVSVHVGAPAAYTDFDAISDVLTGDFEISIP